MKPQLKDKIFDVIATKMNIYFTDRMRSSYDSFSKAFTDANLKLKEQLPERFNQVARRLYIENGRKMHFDEVAYEIWRQQRGSFELEKRNCLYLIQGCFEQSKSSKSILN